MIRIEFAITDLLQLSSLRFLHSSVIAFISVCYTLVGLLCCSDWIYHQTINAKW